MDNLFLLQSTVITGGEGTAPATTNAEVQQPADAGSTGTTPGGTTGTMGMLAVWAVMLVGIYYFSMRSTKKREATIQAKQDAIKLGDDVVTTSGMHGKVVDIADATFSIEFGVNKGIIVPVNKRDVLPAKLDLDAKPAKKGKEEEKAE